MRKVFSVDGNVNSGKTTFLKYICHLNLNEYEYIQEHSDFIDKTKVENSNYDYLKTEVSRYRIFKKSVKNVFLLDRSFVSIAAHVHAANGINSRNWDCFIYDLNRLFIEKSVIIPNHFIFLDTPYDLCLNRFSKTHNLKNTEGYLIEENYFNKIRDFNINWIHEFDGTILLDSPTLNISTLTCFEFSGEKIISFLKKLTIQ